MELPLGTIIGYKSLSKKIRYAVALKNEVSVNATMKKDYEIGTSEIQLYVSILCAPLMARPFIGLTQCPTPNRINSSV